jgi:hypothetical protein
MKTRELSQSTDSLAEPILIYYCNQNQKKRKKADEVEKRAVFILIRDQTQDSSVHCLDPERGRKEDKETISSPLPKPQEEQAC